MISNFEFQLLCLCWDII